VAAGEPIFLYRDYLPFRSAPAEATAPIPGAERRSPYEPYHVASRGGTGSAVAFIRDPRSTVQVWSREHGYPGEFSYLEFHKKHFPGGLRFWRITDTSGDLGRKAVYDPKVAQEKVGLQASHFVGLVRETLDEEAGGRGVVCAPYDAELFGHWWFEGPSFLDFLLRKIAFDQNDIKTILPSEYLDRFGDLQPAAPPECSWGAGGFHEVWLNGTNDWIYPYLHAAADRMSALARRFQHAHGRLRWVLDQAARELLLAQASDWAFIMKTGTSVDYAVRRFKTHIHRFDRLANMVEQDHYDEAYLAAVASRDTIFPDMDYRIFQARPYV